MGWSFAYHDVGRKAHIESLTSGKHFSAEYQPLEHRAVGNNLWQLVLEKSTGRKFICLDLIAKERNGGWGHKGLSEDMGPCEVNCPLSLLNKASPVEKGFAVGWREKVLAHHAAKAGKPALKAGLLVKYGEHVYRLDCSAGPRRGWNVTRIDGVQFRMKAQQLSRAIPVE